MNYHLSGHSVVKPPADRGRLKAAICVVEVNLSGIRVVTLREGICSQPLIISHRSYHFAIGPLKSVGDLTVVDLSLQTFSKEDEKTETYDEGCCYGHANEGHIPRDHAVLCYGYLLGAVVLRQWGPIRRD